MQKRKLHACKCGGVGSPWATFEQYAEAVQEFQCGVSVLQRMLLACPLHMLRAFCLFKLVMPTRWPTRNAHGMAWHGMVCMVKVCRELLAAEASRSAFE